MKEDHKTNKNSILAYHIQLIKVITNCAIGKIYETEVKCQSILSIAQIKEHLLDELNLREIKSTLVTFLEEVH